MARPVPTPWGAGCAKSLARIALRIDHIGSTSVRGLDAKPIIDIQVSVASFGPLDAYRLPLQRAGFVYRPGAELTKRYFRERPGERRTHIHVRRAGSSTSSSPCCPGTSFAPTPGPAPPTRR